MTNNKNIIKNTKTNNENISVEEYHYQQLSDHAYDEKEITENIHEYEYKYAYNSAISDEYNKSDSDVSSNISSQISVIDLLLDHDDDDDAKMADNDDVKDEKYDNDDDMLQKEIQKTYTHTQQVNLGALYIHSKHGWCLDGALVPIGERQQPVINLMVPMIALNLELSIHYIRQLQLRTDGTHRNKNIHYYMFNKFKQLYPQGIKNRATQRMYNWIGMHYTDLFIVKYTFVMYSIYIYCIFAMYLIYIYYVFNIHLLCNLYTFVM